MRLPSHSDSARDDLVAIALHIAVESGSRAVAEAFADKLEQSCERLAALPGTHGTARPELRDDLRSTPCRAYVIFFRYLGTRLEIVNVLHASRDIVGHFDEDGGRDWI